METVFENKCVYTKKHLLEMVKRTQKNSTGLYIIIEITCMLGAFARFTLHDPVSIGIFSVLCAGIVGITIFSPNIIVYKMLKQYNELYHAEYKSTILFFPEHMVDINEQTGGKTDIEYLQIIKVKQTKGLYLITMRANLVILIDKNGFTKGDGATFETFIKEKAAKAKIRL